MKNKIKQSIFNPRHGALKKNKKNKQNSTLFFFFFFQKTDLYCFNSAKFDFVLV